MDALPATQAVTALTPGLQYGFAFFALLQLAVIVWMFRSLLAQLRSTTRVIHGNTAAVRAVRNVADTTETLVQEVRDRLLTLHCVRESPP